MASVTPRMPVQARACSQWLLSRDWITNSCRADRSTPGWAMNINHNSPVGGPIATDGELLGFANLPDRDATRRYSSPAQSVMSHFQVQDLRIAAVTAILMIH